MLNPCLRWNLRNPESYAAAKAEGTFGPLPSHRTIQRYKNKVPSTPWINDRFLQWMKTDAENKSLPRNGWLGGLLVDEMSIQVSLMKQLLPAM